MRPPVLAAVTAAAAVLGGVAGVVLADQAGLVGGETTVSAVAPAVTTAAPPTESPTTATAPTGFDPAAIYADRSPGVVTIYADLGPDGQSQGSGFVVDAAGTILTNAH
ncbi:MAG: hypothetical protein OEW31_01195, partial [Thermoleophilia bacterium]|nr:hypothetical protein [Thermoleophilia bacterium]